MVLLRAIEDGAVIDRAVAWHLDVVALDFGAVTPANAMTAPAMASGSRPAAVEGPTACAISATRFVTSTLYS